MAKIRYYLSLFPAEALVASQLDPNQFGSYMAVGTNKSTSEQLIFAEVEGDFGSDFDWSYAKEKCVEHSDGSPKNSLYLSIYRTLEMVPIKQIKALYLTTRDGRSLKLDPCDGEAATTEREYHVYQELCPMSPLVVSRMEPADFIKLMTDRANKINVPKLLVADLKVIDFDNLDSTGNIGALYDRNIRHLKACIDELRADENKQNKTINRSHAESFSFNVISTGLTLGDKDGVLSFELPDADTLEREHYDWARSAQII